MSLQVAGVKLARTIVVSSVTMMITSSPSDCRRGNSPRLPLHRAVSLTVPEEKRTDTLVSVPQDPDTRLSKAHDSAPGIVRREGRVRRCFKRPLYRSPAESVAEARRF